MLKLAQEHRAIMVAHAQEGFPNEACGLLAGEVQGDEKVIKKVYCLNNLDQSPEHFSMAPEEQFKAVADLRKNGLVLLGNFHSHPGSPARPSDEDIRLAFDPTLSYVIISLQAGEPVLKSFLIRQGTVSEEAVQV
ncbi:MAG: M67 family metallopeptidase [Treponema sp.]|jgi:proteasome lid subunit RPN8/RPN11|nr:M67 family metallopeptidase [Treponema sp.]